MKPLMFVAWVVIAVSALGQVAWAADAGLPRSAPEAEGVKSQGILDFLGAIENSKHEFHGLVIVRHGKVVAEGWWAPYRADLKHTLYSTSKSFTSTAVGFAVGEKKLSVKDKVVSFFPELVPATVSENLAKLTVQDMLMMSAGQDPDPTGRLTPTDNWEREFLATPVINVPGSKFLYNSMATYMCSAIVTKVTGQKVADYLKPRLFDPLGITDYDWEASPTGNSSGGWGLRVRTEDLAKFGLLYLQKGQWNGKQILAKEWVEEATAEHILQAPDAPKADREKSDWMQGYGYQFWRCRNGYFRGDGAFGQYIIVMQDKDAVIAINSETEDMQGILNLVWQHLLPAMGDGKLAANDTTTALQSKLKALSLPVPAKGVASPLQSAISGKSYVVEANGKKLNGSLKFDGDHCIATFEDDKGSYSIPFGSGAWAFSETMRLGPNLVGNAKNHMQGLPPRKIAAAYSWKDDKTLELTLRYIESPHTEKILAVFDGETVTLTWVKTFPGAPQFKLSGTMK